MTFKIRKITLALISAAALFLFGTVTAFAGNTLAESNSNSEGYILGDANGDGYVTISDATSIQMFIVELPVGDDFSEYAADVDGDGEIKFEDAVTIQKWVAEIELSYSIGEFIEFPVATTAQPTTEAPTQPPTDDDGWGRIIFQP
jgi:hypothetical protein